MWRWMAVVFAIGLLHASAYALLVPPWQAPDEPGHMEYACLMGQLGRVPGVADRSVALQADIIASLGRHDFWPLVREATPDPLPGAFAADAFLRRSGTQVGDEPAGYYLVPGLICRLGVPMEARLRLVRLFGAVLFGLTGAVAAWGAGWQGRVGPSGSRVSRGPGKGGLEGFGVDEGARRDTRQGLEERGDSPGRPCHPGKERRARSYDGTGVWEAIGDGWCGGAGMEAAGEEEPGARWGGIGLLQLVPLVLVLLPMPAFIAGSANNDGLAMLMATAVFAALMRWQRLGWTWPRLMGLVGLLALALASKKTTGFLVPWAMLLAVLYLWRRYAAARDGLRLAWRHIGPAFLAVVAIPFLVGAIPAAMPAAWQGRYLAPGVLQPGREGRSGTGGALVVPRAGAEEGRLFQTVPEGSMEHLRGHMAYASLRVRAAAAAPVHGRLTVRDGDGYSEMEFVAGPQWQTVSLAHSLDPMASYVKLAVTAIGDSGSGEGLVVDDAFLGLRPSENLLANPSFEERARWLDVWVVPLLARWTQFLPAVQSSTSLSPATLVRYALYVPLTFAGFWANFGWLQRPLPASAYGVPAVLGLVAALGLVRLLRGQGAGGQIKGLVGPWLLALLLIMIQTFAPILGRAWQPQGRYLFPALVPIVGLGVVGIGQWTALRRRPELLRGGLALLVGFDIICLIWASYGG